MPVILHPREFDRWLDCDETERLPLDLLRPLDSDDMMMFEAHPNVGNVRNNGPELMRKRNGQARAERCRCSCASVLTVPDVKPHSEPHERKTGFDRVFSSNSSGANMPPKPVQIYGVLSKVTLAKDQPSTSNTSPEMEKAQPVKVKPAALSSKKKKVN